MLNDVLPAARLGCRTALFAGDARSYRPREGELRGLGVKPDLVVTNLPQIPQSLI
jgi:putative hydrolase of the HAD superfamily